MLNRYARVFWTRVFTPFAALLLRLRVTPDAVTVVGTLGVVVGALTFYPAGQLWWGSVVIAAFSLTDLLDGTMARLSGQSSAWGAWLDSTMDRLGDAAIFSGLLFYFTGVGDSPLGAALALLCLVLGFVTSYSKARAEGLGLRCEGGIAERADRLLVVLTATGFTGLFLPLWVLLAVLAALAAAGLVTIGQRTAMVRAQTREAV
ncbi:phosphatidylinositol phosphate synthase [Ornithinimicrobium sediminis]|jgi:CDP-diacylglycerol---glycerol-3-phosphate 3-phosphatidyltransferase|uniref:phosphatidylinositol phosphate synthase n=1 Tax=Ornithinimicrobium sediminis TaxID=2904603 RepID=UPI001E2B0FA7|nr:CDP-alcohol phosphatidyltransferase family protein [Ornithinimicrobium sediminis]MCE0487779.1 CDP-alcohol phosphatidyltransferase family protein [Ornithinimicrobium sediminis]